MTRVSRGRGATIPRTSLRPRHQQHPGTARRSGLALGDTRTHGHTQPQQQQQCPELFHSPSFCHRILVYFIWATLTVYQQTNNVFTLLVLRYKPPNEANNMSGICTRLGLWFWMFLDIYISTLHHIAFVTSVHFQGAICWLSQHSSLLTTDVIGIA